MDVIKAIESEQMKDNVGGFRVGDTVKVYFKIIEGDKERIQIYEGLVIAFNNGGIRKTVTIRKNSYGVGVERIFPVCSPFLNKIEVNKRGKVRRARIFYLRERTGKSARIKEKMSFRK
jgi:large subunit ribosomal protein L19